MKILVAQSSAIARGGAGHARALRDSLTTEGHQTEHLDLPPLNTHRRALTNVASYRLINAAGSADALICLDAVASVLPHPRKILWLLDDEFLDPEGASVGGRRLPEATYLANVLRSAIREAGTIFSPSSFAAERLRRLGVDGASLFMPPLAPPPVLHARAGGPEVLLLAPLTDRYRPELLIATLATLPEPYRARWVAPFAQQGWLARARKLAAEWQVDRRVAFDVRAIDEGEQSYLLAHALALVDLGSGSLVIADRLHAAIAHATPVIACIDGGAATEVSSHCAKPVASDLGKAIVAACGPLAAPPTPREARRPASGGWEPLLRAVVR